MIRKPKKISLWHFIIILSTILISLNSWRDIPKYCKNLIYTTIFSGLYYLLCRRHLVWEFNPGSFQCRLIRFIYAVIVTPLLTLLFLSKFPNTLMSQIVYFIKWVLFVTIMEHFAHKQKLIRYAHGWSIYWSGVIYALDIYI